MSGIDRPESRSPLQVARDLFFKAIHKSPLQPNLHAVIVQAPPIDHPETYLDAPLPEAIRDKPWINAYLIPLFPSAKIHYYGDSGLLGHYRDLSRTAISALRESSDHLDSLAKKVRLAHRAEDADQILADFCLLFLRNAITEWPGREYLMERWIWGVTPATAHVPYRPDDRIAWRQANPSVIVPENAPDVTTFTHDVFTTSVAVIDFMIRELVGPVSILPPENLRRCKPLPESTKLLEKMFDEASQLVGALHPKVDLLAKAREAISESDRDPESLRDLEPYHKELKNRVLREMARESPSVDLLVEYMDDEVAERIQQASLRILNRNLARHQLEQQGTFDQKRALLAAFDKADLIEHGPFPEGMRLPAVAGVHAFRRIASTTQQPRTCSICDRQ